MSTASVTAARARRWRSFRGAGAVPTVVAVLVMVVLGLAVRGNGFWVLIASTAAISYVFTGSYNLIFGSAGLFSLAHAALYGVGAYTSVVLETTYGWSFWPATLGAVVAAVVLGVLVAIPTARLEGAFLALGTLAFATAVSAVLVNWTDVTGGTQGFLGIIPPMVGGRELVGGTIDYYWFAGVFAVLSFVVFRRINASGAGRRFVALRESEVSAQASGINPVRTRVLAFAISSLFAGLAGVLYSHLALFISPESFALNAMIQVLIVTLIGGSGYLYGPVCGVVALVAINQVVQRSGDGGQLIFGLAVILVIAFAPSGLMGSLERLWRYIQRRRGFGAGAVGNATSSVAPEAPELADSDQRILLVRDVSLHFAGVMALEDVDIRIESGEVIGLIGPNGAGKTSLVNVVTGAAHPQSGSVTIDETELLEHKPFEVARLGVARTFQTTQLIPSFDLLTNVMLGRDTFASATLAEDVLRLPRSKGDDDRARRAARQLLALVGVSDYADVRAADAPYGVIRRAEIAKAMALQPSFLLLDEPGAGLSSYERDEVRSAIHAVAAHGVGCLLIDHNVSFVADTCERLVVLAAGRILAEGPTREVLEHPDVMTAYLGKAAVS